MDSALCFGGGDELKTSYYGNGDTTTFSRYYNPNSKESKYWMSAPNDRSDADADTYYSHANRQNLRRTDKAQKDYNDLHQKSKQYGTQLDAEDL